MRRTRFAGAVEVGGEARPRASIREALWFDIRAPDAPDDHSLSAWRVAPLDHSALMLGVTHLIAAITLFLFYPERSPAMSLASPVIPMALLLALDAVAIVALHCRHRLGLAPHTVIRALAAYLGVAGILWIMIGLAITGAAHGEALAILVMGGGVTMAPPWWR